MTMLFMGSGKLVRNYDVLMKYFEKLRELGVDTSSCYPTGSDVEEVKSLAERGEIKNLDDAVRFLVAKFRGRVNAVAAQQAVRDVMGIEVSPDAAVEYVAKLLALWTLEMCESMGLIKIVGAEKYLR